MSTNKNFDRICCIVLAFVLVITVLFVNGEKLGLTIASKAMGYESRLFDTSYVHTIDIEMDDWDSFLETCKSEEYTTCSLVIDNEAYKNVAIRGKGNTSLTQVESYGNNRYSFKVEFDAYDSSITYHGLDKLCLNNIIQDNTYMKDYLVYTMMNEFGVSSPLCSYVYITVNGEDWGLYLAVEGVEDSFLQRNYGNDDVNLYKPDSQSMGGGRGNGEGFDMDKFNEEFGEASTDTDSSTEETTTAKADTKSATEEATTAKSDSTEEATASSSQQNGTVPSMPGNGEMPSMPSGDFDGEMPSMPNQSSSDSSDSDSDSEAFTMPSMPSGDGQTGEIPELPDGVDASDIIGGKGGGMDNGMGSDDVKLIYSDDEYDSYSNIFNNAKTDITDSDKDTLIASLKSINENTDLESTVDIEQVIRYFVVHNFVLNGDSYTGSMIHNYYLSENDGILSMIPWDYNLAFGGFQSMGGAESLVNSPIDSPVSGGDTDSRPMLAWIFNNEEYTEEYHELFAEFISSYFDSGEFETEIDRVKEMISPYVEKDPTKFCTYDEFIKGIDTLKEFCLLRAESVTLQLDGTIGITSDEQTDTTNFVKADDITISDMGSMNNGGGMDKPDGNGGQGGENTDGTPPEKPDGDTSTTEAKEKSTTTADEKSSDTESTTEAKANASDDSDNNAKGFGGGGTPPEMPSEGGQGGGMPSGGNGSTPPEMPNNSSSNQATTSA